MSARVTEDGMVYSTDFGTAVVRFSMPFSEMDSDELGKMRTHLLNRIDREERELAERREVYEKASAASRKASNRESAAYRAVDTTEGQLAVLNEALRDSLTQVNA